MERMTLNGIYKLKYFDYATFPIENAVSYTHLSSPPVPMYSVLPLK